MRHILHMRQSFSPKIVRAGELNPRHAIFHFMLYGVTIVKVIWHRNTLKVLFVCTTTLYSTSLNKSFIVTSRWIIPEYLLRFKP